MKLASITAAAVAALVMAAAVSTPAAACKWKKAGYHGYRTADAGGGCAAGSIASTGSTTSAGRTAKRKRPRGAPCPPTSHRATAERQVSALLATLPLEFADGARRRPLILARPIELHHVAGDGDVDRPADAMILRSPSVPQVIDSVNW